MTPRSVRWFIHLVLVVLASTGFAAAGFANGTGITGASGKEQGFFCQNCHVGGAVPDVAFDGPVALEPGAVATYRFTVTSNSEAQVAAGMNVAASDGTFGLLAAHETRLELNEVTHVEPKANDDGQAAFEFTWQAPETAGIYTLFGAGTSANLNDLRFGDDAARVEFDVFVGVPAPTPAATATPTTGPGCVGDCDGSGDITVDEVITGVNMGLGQTPIDACPAFDGNIDGAITVDEILQAVNSALTGCPG